MSKKDLKFLSFPADFLWGASTSAHQIEGGTNNDWTQWESSPERLANLKAQGKNTFDYESGQAANSWELYEEDFNLIQDLNCGGYRFGIEWSRIEPEEGKFNLEALRHYKTMLTSLKERNLKTVLTIWHWTNPIWFAELGGWTNRDSVKYFTRFTNACVEEFGDLVDLWIVLNEPTVHILNGYLKGKFPPHHQNPWQAQVALHNLIKAQKKAYTIIKENTYEAQVGLTTLANFIEPADKHNFFDQALAKLANFAWNRYFVYRTRNHVDFIALDYYFHNRLAAKRPHNLNLNKLTTDLGWEIFPLGIYEVIKEFSRYKLPIYIMENGLADEEDKNRANFIKEHLYYIHQAISDGYAVKGYFHWSLLDNFEWAEGHTAKFGLYQVNRQTFERTARPSATVYAQTCKDNGFWAEY